MNISPLYKQYSHGIFSKIDKIPGQVSSPRTNRQNKSLIHSSQLSKKLLEKAQTSKYTLNSNKPGRNSLLNVHTYQENYPKKNAVNNNQNSRKNLISNSLDKRTRSEKRIGESTEKNCVKINIRNKPNLAETQLLDLLKLEKSTVEKLVMLKQRDELKQKTNDLNNRDLAELKKKVKELEQVKAENLLLKEKLERKKAKKIEIGKLKGQLKTLIHTIINVLEKIFLVQIDPKKNNSHFYEIQLLITKRLYELNESKCGVDLLDELERLSALQTNIQDYLKKSIGESEKSDELEQIDEEQDSHCESSVKNNKGIYELDIHSIVPSHFSENNDINTVSILEKHKHSEIMNKNSFLSKENIENNNIIEYKNRKMINGNKFKSLANKNEGYSAKINLTNQSRKSKKIVDI